MSRDNDIHPAIRRRRFTLTRRRKATVAAAAGWAGGDGGEFLDNYLRVTRRAKTVVRNVFGG